jgi:hypothetical protein
VKRVSWLTVLTLIFVVLGGMERLPAASAQGTIPPSIFMQSPREGQALQGLEIIEGKIRGEGFLAGRVRFSYAGGEGGDPTWFFIADVEPAVEDSSQTSFRIEWDTTQLTDGNYHLRVVAEYEGGAAIFETIPNLRIRNYSPVETPTPQAVEEGTQAEQPTLAPDTPQPRNSPTPLPDNPVVIQPGELPRILTLSGIAVAGAFFLGMMYWFIKTRIE